MLSTETRAALQSSLVLLKARERFTQVKLWGRVQGIYRDYYVAHGYGDDELREKKAFYSVDNCVTFLELPKIHPVTAASAQRISSRFTGTSTHEYTVKEPGPAPDSAPLDLPAEVESSRTIEESDGVSELTTVIKEDQRLAAVVDAIEFECAAVPRGAYIRDAADKLIPVRQFSGLSRADAGKLHSYCHLRIPVKERTVLERAQQDKTLDFLDLISDDVPEGSWFLQYERGGAVVVMKSAVWLGYVFYHVPETNKFGYVYNGTGQRNQDLAFMLPNRKQQ